MEEWKPWRTQKNPYRKLHFKGSAAESKPTWPMGTCPWHMLFCWGEGGKPVFWGCDSDPSIPTKPQLRESSEEQWAGNALAQSRSHLANTSLTFWAACQVWGSHSGWWRHLLVLLGEQWKLLPFLSHAVTGTSQLLTRLGDTDLFLHLQVLLWGSVLPLP